MAEPDTQTPTETTPPPPPQEPAEEPTPPDADDPTSSQSSAPAEPLDDEARVKACLVALYDFLLTGPPMPSRQQHFFREFIKLIEPVRTVWAHVDRPGLGAEPKE